MARAHAVKKGGSKRIYKKHSRLPARKQFQLWLRENHPMSHKNGSSVASEDK